MVLDQPRISMQPTLQRISQFADLGHDWDSYGAAPPTTKALIEAIRLATGMAERFAPAVGQRALPWMVAPLADGGVQIEWRGASGALEVEISPEGQFGYLLETGHGSTTSYQEGDHVSGEEVEHLLASVRNV